MKHRTIVSVSALALLLLWARADALETLLELGLEGRVYSHSAPPPSHRSKLAASFKPKITEQFEEQKTYLTFEPFFRLDQYDEERNHADIRELKAIKASDDWEFEGGISQIFWGVAESNHLVDIINQTDALEGVDGEDKLGQPLLRASRILDQSTLSGFVLPGFRERQFLGAESRFALPFTVDTNNAQYESSDGVRHIDYALRYSGYTGPLDYGLSWFKGTSRDPDFRPAASASDGVIPYYEQIERWGLDAQYTVDAWLWKLEAIHQRSSQPSYSAYVGGLEYTIYNLQDGAYDLGLIAEYSHDSRDDPQRYFLQNDVFLGARFAFTDADSSQILAGAFIDADDNSQVYRVEASKRVLGDATLSLEAQLFNNTAETNVNHAFQNNDFLRLELAWYF